MFFVYDLLIAKQSRSQPAASLDLSIRFVFVTLPLTVSGLHQLGVAVLWRLSLGRGAGSRASLHLDPVAGGGVGGVVGVAGDIWRGRVVLWV